MSVTYYPARPAVPLDLADEGAHRRDLARATNLLLAGHNSATLQFTLTAGATSSTLIDPRISLQTAVILVPMTQDAAADVSNIYIVPSKGQAVIYHASKPQADQTFQVALIG